MKDNKSTVFRGPINLDKWKSATEKRFDVDELRFVISALYVVRFYETNGTSN